MIEQNDINDGTIIAGTTQRTDDKNNVKFLFKLPSGKVMCSEWIAPDMRKTALLRWLEAVRVNVVDDLNTTRRERIEAARAANPPVVHRPIAPDVASPGLVVPTGTISTKTVQHVTDSVDPVEYAHSQVVQAQTARDDALNMYQVAVADLGLATERLAQWKRVLIALGGQEFSSGQEGQVNGESQGNQGQQRGDSGGQV